MRCQLYRSDFTNKNCCNSSISDQCEGQKSHLAPMNQQNSVTWFYFFLVWCEGEQNVAWCQEQLLGFRFSMLCVGFCWFPRWLFGSRMAFLAGVRPLLTFLSSWSTRILFTFFFFFPKDKHKQCASEKTLQLLKVATDARLDWVKEKQVIDLRLVLACSPSICAINECECCLHHH